jgi:hypothetical protein
MQSAALDYIPAAERSKFIWSLHVQDQTWNYYGASYHSSLLAKYIRSAILLLYAVLELSPLTAKWSYDVKDDLNCGTAWPAGFKRQKTRG